MLDDPFEISESKDRYLYSWTGISFSFVGFESGKAILVRCFDFSDTLMPPSFLPTRRISSKVILLCILTIVIMVSRVGSAGFSASAQIKLHAAIETTSPNAQSGGNFGWSVATGGSIVVVGAPSENASAKINAGNAYLFNVNTGLLKHSLSSPKAQPNGYFGYSVASSSNGGLVVVGAPLENASAKIGAGKAYVLDATTGLLSMCYLAPLLKSAENLGFQWQRIAES